MPALSFQPQFRAPILARTKNHTIRGATPRGWVPGHWVPLYTGMRTKHVQLIGSALAGTPYEVRLDFDQDPCIEADAPDPNDDSGRGIRVFARDAGKVLGGPSAKDEFAISDGFTSWAEMDAFWLAQHPKLRAFTGALLPWTDFTTEHRLGAPT